MPSLIVPVTRHGRLSVGLSVVSLVSLAVFFLMVGLGQRGGAGFFDNWLLTGPILVVAIAGTGGLIAGTSAILRLGERNLPVVLGIPWGLVVTLFWAAEVVAPH